MDGSPGLPGPGNGLRGAGCLGVAKIGQGITDVSSDADLVPLSALLVDIAQLTEWIAAGLVSA